MGPVTKIISQLVLILICWITKPNSKITSFLRNYALRGTGSNKVGAQISSLRLKHLIPVANIQSC